MVEPRGGAGEVGRWIGGIFRIFMFLIAALLFFGVIVVILVLVFNIGTGGAGEYFGELGLIKLEEDGSRAAGKLGLGDKLRLIVSPESFTDRTVWSDTIPVDDTGEVPKVEIVDIKPNANYYFPGDEIVAAVGVDADSRKEEPSLAYFSCELEDYKDMAVVDPEEFELDAIIGLQKTAFFCEFPSGLKGNSKRDTTSVLTAKVKYEYEQGAALRVYFMDDATLRAYTSNRKNPLDAWDEPLFNKNDGTIRSQADPGPMRIAIEVPSSQPFSETIPRYPLRISFARDLEYTGKFLNFTSFRLKIPTAVELLEEKSCDFQLVDYDGEFRVYEIKEEVIKKTFDVDCKTYDYLTEEQCIDAFVNMFSFDCSFRVNSLPEGEQFFSNFALDVAYEFEASKKKPIIVKKGSFGRGCEGVDEFECQEIKGCMPIYGENELDYLRCDACPENWLYCEDYGSSQVLCELDPCSAQEEERCGFVDGKCTALG